MNLIYKFRVNYVNKLGNKAHLDVEASSDPRAREYLLTNRYIEHYSQIINVTNLTVIDYVYQVANAIISSGKEHSNPTIRGMAVFSKPVAAVATELIKC